MAIFGGTFDPPHTGHVETIRYVLSHTELNRIVVIPAFSPPHKQEKLSTDFEHRLAMTKIAYAEWIATGQVVVSDMEREISRPSYTYNTLQNLRNEFPEAARHVIVGEDMYATLSTWNNYERLRKEYSFIVMHRSGVNPDLYREIHQNKDMLLRNPIWEISSTDLKRKLLARDNSEEALRELKFWIPPNVFSYIVENNLYSREESL